MCFNNFSHLPPPTVADAVEEHGDRDADEFIAASWAALDGGLDYFTRMRADVHRVDGKALTIGCSKGRAAANVVRCVFIAHGEPLRRGHMHGR